MVQHWSDCAVHNEPALPAGPCDCGALELADDPSHSGVIAPVPGARSAGPFVGEVGSDCLIQAHELPADVVPAGASSAHLPGPHDGIAVLGVPSSMDLNPSGVSVVSKL